jgi:hypothetical protein
MFREREMPPRHRRGTKERFRSFQESERTFFAFPLKTKSKPNSVSSFDCRHGFSQSQLQSCASAMGKAPLPNMRFEQTMAEAGIRRHVLLDAIANSTNLMFVFS